jgi:DNA polymerase-3 subunit gamma/tau
MAYQVLARTWRPQRFADVIAQEAVVQTLHNALSAATLGHAYLFSGLRGVGKTTVARLLAKAVNCSNGPTTDTCDACPSCQEIASGSSLDVVELDGASNRGIDDVRELRELLRFSPVRDRYRVIIIDEVHMLTREAFNALLKSLEEPPPYILFIFATTEIHKVPATILSRCQQLEFRPVPVAPIAHRLLMIAEKDGFGLTTEAASTVARAAQGSVRDALSLIDQLRAFSADNIDGAAVAEVLGVPRFEAVLDLISMLAAGDGAAGLGALRAELDSGHDAWVLYQEVGRALRIVLHLAVAPDVADDLVDDQRDRAVEIASSLGADALVRMAGLWLEHEALVSAAGNRELALEVACLRLSRWPAVKRVEALLAGEPPPQAAGSGGGSKGAKRPDAGGRHAAETAGGRFSGALWGKGEKRLAGVVEGAAVSIDEGSVTLTFSTAKNGVAEFANGEARAELESTCREVFGDDVRLQLHMEAAQEETAADGPLMRMACADPGVEMVRRIMGGEVVAVHSDGRAN